MIKAGSQGMFSAKGRMTIHLFPQFQGERKLETKRPEVSYTLGREKRARLEKKKKDEFFFYNILDYNKEAEAKLRDTTYIKQVVPHSPVRRSAHRQVQATLQGRLGRHQGHGPLRLSCA